MTATVLQTSQALHDALGNLYAIDRELGRGGMATVYLAQDLRHNRLVALKVLHREVAESLGAERFLREIQTAARLNHPHILPLFDSGAAGRFLYYVMPYVEGESLRQALDRLGQIPADEAIAYVQEMAAALDYAHRQGIVHRDIKPENVMLHEGIATLMDFGIAKALDGDSSRGLTQAGMFVGTPAYVSPEQAFGESAIDGRSDQFSLACMLYEMITGEQVFTGVSTQAAIRRGIGQVRHHARVCGEPHCGRTFDAFVDASDVRTRRLRSKIGWRAPIRKPERRSGKRISRRWNSRGDHQRVVEGPNAARCVTCDFICDERKARRSPGGRTQAQGIDCAQRIHSKIGKSHSRKCRARECLGWIAVVG